MVGRDGGVSGRCGTGRGREASVGTGRSGVPSGRGGRGKRSGEWPIGRRGGGESTLGCEGVLNISPVQVGLVARRPG